jgi:Zn-dependent membrane protease YugP
MATGTIDVNLTAISNAINNGTQFAEFFLKGFVGLGQTAGELLIVGIVLMIVISILFLLIGLPARFINAVRGIRTFRG